MQRSSSVTRAGQGTHPAASRRLAVRGHPLFWIAALLTILCAGTTSADAAHRVDAYLSGIDSLQADFEQFTFNADRTQMLEARGTLYLQRPDRFRWEYANPMQQVIVADGKRVYLHDLDLQQVTHQSQAEALRGTPALLLADRDPVERQFKVREIESTDGRYWVELTPRDEDTEILRIELGFGNDLGQDRLDSIIMVDSFGQETRLNFSGSQRNLALAPDLFRIDPRAMDDFLRMD